MEEVKEECPTEILVELKEDSSVASHSNQNGYPILFDDSKSDAHFKNEEYSGFAKKSEDNKSILDMSPFRIKEKFHQKEASNIDFEAKQDFKMDINIDDCPTGILVDIPNNLNSTSKACSFSYNTVYSKMSHLQNSIIKTTDSEKEACLSNGIKNCRLSDDTDNGCYSKSNEEENKSLASKSGFKAPSPQSMALISIEVSKVIDNLNSSAFDEDDLLNEEMLPIPLTFDDFDDISDKENQLLIVTDACESKTSFTIQTHDSSNKSDKNIENDTVFCAEISKNLKVSSNNEHSESPLSADAGCSPAYSYNAEKIVSDEHSKEHISSEIKSDSLDISNISSANSTDNVFIMSHIDEDKENAQGNKVVLSKKNTVSAMKSRITSKRMSLSNSFHFQSSKELMPSLQRPGLVDPTTIFRQNPPYKSYIKQDNFDKMRSSFATPSKRYSISTPLQGAALKPQFTPSLQGSKKCALPRFAPQSVGSSRFSFSKSLQPSSKDSHFPMRQQYSTPSVSAKSSRQSSARLNSTKPEKSFSKGTFASNSKTLGKNCLSTSNTKRFCSKLSLSSPFSAAQDKHLARSLFPSDP